MIGKTISHYKITEKLGQGGMGIIYKAEDTILKRTVALKFLPPELILDPQAKERFIHEAQAASALDHPNICNIHEISETEDLQLFICMNYYKGESLRQLIRKGPIPIERATNIILQIAKGLKAAHDEKIIHRDIKPANIIITPKGEVKIVDFGLAKLAGEKLTESYSTKGTIAYMAPEFIRGLPGGQRSDIWSLGVVFYEMLTGNLPFTGAFPEPMMYSIVNKKPKLLSHYLENVPELIQKIIDKLLKKNPQERYQTIDELLTDLASLRVSSSAFNEDSFSNKIIRTLRRQKNRYILASVALVILTFIFITFLNPLIENNVFYPDPPRIVLISFENHTGDDLYDIWEKGIPNLLISKLSMISGLHVTSWERLHDLKKELGKREVDFIDLDLGIQLSKLEGAEMIITGTLFKAGQFFATDVKVFDAGSKKILKTASAQGEGEASILKYQIDNLSRDIIKELGFSEHMMASLKKPVSVLTTSSSEAYKYYLMGNEKKSLWRFAEARPFYELAVKYDSTFGLAYYQLGKWIYKPLGLNKKSEQALAKAMYCLEQSSDYESLVWRWDYYLHRDIYKSDSLLKVLIEKYGMDTSAHYRLGCAYKVKKDYGKAIEEFERVIRINPRHVSSNLQLGYCYLYTHNYNPALKYFKTAITLDPTNANTFDSLADTYREMGNIEGMISSLEQGYAADPNFPWAAEELAKSYAFKEEYNKAVEWTMRLTGPFKNRPDTGLYIQSLYYFLQGRWQKALTNLDKAVQAADSLSASDNIESEIPAIGRILKAWIFCEMDNFEKGREVLESIPESFLDSGYNIYRHKFEILAQLRSGNLDSAKYYYEKYLEDSKDITKFSQADRKLFSFLSDLIKTEILLVENKSQSALALSQQLKFGEWDIFTLERREYTLLPFQQDLMARALLKSGKLELAIKEYERLISDDPNLRGWQFIPAKYHYILGTLYEQKGWPGKAIDQYEHLLKIWHNADKDIPEIINARKRLSDLRKL